MSKLIYLASPYSHPDVNVRVERFHAAVNKVAHMARNGLHVYSPIVHWHPVAIIHDLPLDANFWQEQNFSHIARSTALWVLMIDGFEQSKGVRAEIDYAYSLGIPVVMTEPVHA